MPPTHEPTELTRLFLDLENGDEQAVERIFPLVYDELRGMAAHYMRAERRAHTLQPTALVHESYVRLLGPQKVGPKSRSHFLWMAARAMRQILVEHARARNAQKRGGGAQKISLERLPDHPEDRDPLLLALDDALGELSRLDERQANVVELRFFGGFTIEETADVLGLSHATVERDWKVAKAWLSRQIQRTEADGG